MKFYHDNTYSFYWLEETCFLVKKLVNKKCVVLWWRINYFQVGVLPFYHIQKDGILGNKIEN